MSTHKERPELAVAIAWASIELREFLEPLVRVGNDSEHFESFMWQALLRFYDRAITEGNQHVRVLTIAAPMAAKYMTECGQPEFRTGHFVDSCAIKFIRGKLLSIFALCNGRHNQVVPGVYKALTELGTAGVPEELSQIAFSSPLSIRSGFHGSPDACSRWLGSLMASASKQEKADALNPRKTLRDLVESPERKRRNEVATDTINAAIARGCTLQDIAALLSHADQYPCSWNEAEVLERIRSAVPGEIATANWGPMNEYGKAREIFDSLDDVDRTLLIHDAKQLCESFVSIQPAEVDAALEREALGVAGRVQSALTTTDGATAKPRGKTATAKWLKLHAVRGEYPDFGSAEVCRHLGQEPRTQLYDYLRKDKYPPPTEADYAEWTTKFGDLEAYDAF